MKSSTHEEKIQKLKTVKRNLVDSVISVDRNIVKSLTMDDIREIFSTDQYVKTVLFAIARIKR